FVADCERASRRGYAGAALESLGLVAMFLHGPRLVRALDPQLPPEVAPYFWHGVGRAFYFHPGQFLPGRSHRWRDLAPHELARVNLCAGMAWALFLVNMRDPEVMEGVLLEQGEHFADRDLFIDGIVGAVVMRWDTSPGDPWVERFLSHRPSDPLLGRLWQRTIT